MDMNDDVLMASTTSKTTQKDSQQPHSAAVQGPAGVCGTTTTTTATTSVNKTAAVGIDTMEKNAFCSSSIPLKDHGALMASAGGATEEEEQKRAPAGASTNTTTIRSGDKKTEAEKVGTTTKTTSSSNITTTTTSISLLLSSGLSEQVMCQRVLTYLHRTDILQGVMKVKPLRNRFRINDFGGYA